MKKIFKIEATYCYTIEVDEDDLIVKDYENEQEMIEDLVSYRFDILPVLNDGVKVKDVEVIDWTSIK